MNGAAHKGGGLFVKGGEVAVEACAFVGNTADSIGGAIYVVEADFSLYGVTFSGNSAGEAGSGDLHEMFDTASVYGECPEGFGVEPVRGRALNATGGVNGPGDFVSYSWSGCEDGYVLVEAVGAGAGRGGARGLGVALGLVWFVAALSGV